MNGFCVALLLSVTGVDVSWETAQGGQLVYTIRIDPLVLGELRNEKAVESLVDAKDQRNLRMFRIATGARGSATLAPTGGNLGVQYGWEPNPSGGLDYYVQITPERFEGLAKGIPIDCDVLPEVDQIARIYVFVGLKELPRKGGLPINTATNAGYSPANDRGTQQAAATTDPRLGTTGSSTAAFGGNAPTYGSSISNNTNTSATQYSSKTGANWQSETPTTGRYDNYATNAPTTNNYRNEVLAPPRYQEPQTQQSTYARPQSQYEPQGTYTNSAAPPANPYGQQYATQAYAPPAQTYQTQAPAYAPPAPPTNWAQTQAPAAAAPPATTTVAAQAPAASAATSSAARAESQKEFWWSLFLTTMGLFASMGANAYLGWLAWSFFWRYKDAASDVARARTAALQARHAA